MKEDLAVTAQTTRELADRDSRQSAPASSFPHPLPLNHPLARSPQNILALQRTLGNRFVSNLFASHTGAAGARVQAKLTVSDPDDEQEREADRVAGQVMSMHASLSLSRNLLSRKCSACEEEEAESVQRADLSGEHGKGSPTKEVSAALEQRLISSKGVGERLSGEARDFMDSRFGNDFSSVVVHTDGAAAQLSRELNARAFTHGSDVYFGEGESPANYHLLAHELTHVVQQTGGVQREPAPQAPGGKVKANSGPSAVTVRLLALIERLETLHEQADRNFGSCAKSTAAASGGAVHQQGQQHLEGLSSGLAQLREAARSNDESLKRRVLSAFTQQHTGPAKSAGEEKAAAARSADQQTAPARTGQSTPAAIARKLVAGRTSGPDVHVSRYAGEVLVDIGETILEADAVAAPEEAVTGPPGWAVGLGAAALGLAAIGVGVGIGWLASGSGTKPAPGATPATEPVMPEGLSREKKEKWKKCQELYQTYKKGTGADVGSLASEIKALRSRYESLSPKEKLDLCAKVHQQITLVERLINERREYIDNGCDEFDWFGQGTTEAERRRSHEGEVDNVKGQEGNLRGLLKKLQDEGVC